MVSIAYKLHFTYRRARGKGGAHSRFDLPRPMAHGCEWRAMRPRRGCGGVYRIAGAAAAGQRAQKINPPAQIRPICASPPRRTSDILLREITRRLARRGSGGNSDPGNAVGGPGGSWCWWGPLGLFRENSYDFATPPGPQIIDIAT